MKRRTKFRQTRRRGFTLVEVLLVLAILVILGAMVGVGVVQVKKGADKKAAKAQVGMFDEAINLYRIDVGSYPETLEDLRQAPQGLRNPDKWAGPYLQKELPTDPWGNDYQYANEGDDFRVWSFGPDGGDGGNDDIDNKT
jgi:general secretion pathway protein G